MPESVIGERLSAKRRMLSLSQEDLAERAGISRTYLSQIENGSAMNISIDVLGKLAKSLGVKTAFLTGEEGDVELNIDPPLFKYALEENLDFSELTQLNSMVFRGTRPSTPQEWRALHKAIKEALSRLDHGKS